MDVLNVFYSNSILHIIKNYYIINIYEHYYLIYPIHMNCIYNIDFSWLFVSFYIQVIVSSIITKYYEEIINDTWDMLLLIINFVYVLSILLDIINGNYFHIRFYNMSDTFIFVIITDRLDILNLITITFLYFFIILLTFNQLFLYMIIIFVYFLNLLYLRLICLMKSYMINMIMFNLLGWFIYLNLFAWCYY